jgi:hypothetical protein
LCLSSSLMHSFGSVVVHVSGTVRAWPRIPARAAKQATDKHRKREAEQAHQFRLSLSKIPES